jgi:hypothetical protein
MRAKYRHKAVHACRLMRVRFVSDAAEQELY